MKKLIICIIVILFTVMVSGMDPSHAQKKSTLKGFSFNNPKDYKIYPNLHGGVGTIEYMEGFGPEAFGTKHRFLRVGVILPRSSIGEYRAVDADELFIIISGQVYVTVNGRTGLILEGSIVPCRMGETIGIYNPTENEVSFAWIATADEKGKYKTVDLNNDLSDRKFEEPCPITWMPIDLGKYRNNLGVAHGGKGEVFGTYGNIRPPYYKFNWFAGGLLAPPGTSIGYHKHTIHEEMYLVVSGQARGTVDNVTMDLKPGDCILCPLGSSHGIYNNGKEDLLIIVTMLSSLPSGEYLSEDLGDDLTTR
ncbi:cupin domain-containing protein [Candidatus Latescibacterota bacterium]